MKTNKSIRVLLFIFLLSVLHACKNSVHPTQKELQHKEDSANVGIGQSYIDSQIYHFDTTLSGNRLMSFSYENKQCIFKKNGSVLDFVTVDRSYPFHVTNPILGYDISKHDTVGSRVVEDGHLFFFCMNTVSELGRNALFITSVKNGKAHFITNNFYDPSYIEFPGHKFYLDPTTHSFFLIGRNHRIDEIKNFVPFTPLERFSYDKDSVRYQGCIKLVIDSNYSVQSLTKIINQNKHKFR